MTSSVQPLLTIRADAGPGIGLGHVMRSLALAQAWQDLGGKVRFLSCLDAPSLVTRLAEEGFSLEQVSAPYPHPGDLKTLLAATRPGQWVVLDGYHFDTEYQRAVRAAGRKTLVLDDVNDRGTYVADVLLNPSPDAGTIGYVLNADARCLFGAEYVLLRREFRNAAAAIKPQPERVRNVLVLMGGADKADVTSRVLDALAEARFGDLRLRLVVGGANPRLETLRGRAASLPCEIEVLHAVSDMAPLMAWADMAISAAGSTCWELALFGVPLLLVQVADNQAGVARSMAGCGAVVLNRNTRSVDMRAALAELVPDRERRAAMSASLRLLVDGKGAMRTAAVLWATSAPDEVPSETGEERNAH
ncbi:MAG: UDP-2,4-diacetamido-2,4,6-trideoxy-beta-L-altropyranose hydrolase [Desulfovibrionaceae bacterium]